MELNTGYITVMNEMKLNTVHLSKQVAIVLNKSGLSAEELGNKAGVGKSTIYNIIKQKNKTAQRSVARSIAESENYRLRIEGDKAYFDEKKQTDFDELVQQTGQKVKESETFYAGLPDEDRKAAETFIDLLKNGPEKDKIIITSVLEILKGDSS